MTVAFSRPLALLALLGLPYFWWVSKRSLAGLGPWAGRVALSARLIIISALILALAGLRLVTWKDALCVVFLADRSQSIDNPQRAKEEGFIKEAMRTMRKYDRAGLVVFGRDATVEMDPALEARSFDRIQSAVDGEGTDVAQAMRLGLSIVPQGTVGRLVLLSDGNENLGSAHEQAAMARAAGVEVDFLPLDSKLSHEALVDDANAPSIAKRGEPVEVRTSVTSLTPGDAELALYENDREVERRAVTLTAGKNVFSFTRILDQEGVHNFEVYLRAAQDTHPENNLGRAFTWVRGKPRVLYAEGEPREGALLVQALEAQGVEVDLVRAGRLPGKLQDLQQYDAVVLSDVPAWGLSVEQMKMLRSSEFDLGTGLVMLGGEQSFGPGGYLRTPVEEALPVTMDVPKKEHIPGVAVVMIMHSTEMPGGNALARDTVLRVVDNLSPVDKIGAIQYAWGPGGIAWPIPLQPAEDKGKIKALVDGLAPGDMPDFDSSLKVAYQALVKDSARIKHIIILSDGDPAPPSTALADQIVAAKITISTVQYGGHSPADAVNMAALANWGKGRFYQVTDPSRIPDIFLHERMLLGRSAIVEKPFRPAADPTSELLQGIEPQTIPPLLGYVATTPKPLAQMPMTSPEGDPVLANWQHGLGRGVAFTSDAKRHWAAPWVNWELYPKFWAQVIRWAMRKTTAGIYNASMRVRGGEGTLRLEAVDAEGRFVNFLDVQARIATPSGEGQAVALEQVGPGEYRGRFSAARTGTYLATVSTKDSTGNQTQQNVGAVVPYPPEYKDLQANRPLLGLLAETTGGKELESPVQAYQRLGRKAGSPRDIWRWLLGLAAILLPLDVAVRRITVTTHDLALAWAWVAAGVTRRLPFRRKAPAAQPTLERLLTRKGRARERMAAPPAAAGPPPPVGPPPAAVPPPQATRPAPPPPPAPAVSESTLERLRAARERVRRKQEEEK